MKVNLKDKKRFQNLCSFDNVIVLSTNKRYRSNKIVEYREGIKMLSCKLLMFLKRYFYKKYIDANRAKNEKIGFGNDMYLLECYNGFKKNAVLKVVNKLGMDINGVVVNNKYYDKNYSIIIRGDFNPHNMIVLLLLSLLKLFIITVDICRHK